MLLPLSRMCFACGVDNPLGLRARLWLDERHVTARFTPRESLRANGGTLAMVAITALLDEAAFWLGAAASGESGMTTTLRVEMHDAVRFGDTIDVAGSRAAVVPRADDPRYWETDVAAWDGGARLVARARITFVAVRGAARKLVTGLLAMNPPERLRRVFPAYVR
jgi:acyl-coenzyme A thioesterase PaaI-like protein